jgi:hypothetical protein
VAGFEKPSQQTFWSNIMKNASLIVIETKNGHSIPARVWKATDEQDYINRVAASNPRSGEPFEDFEEVKANDEERHAMRVEIMRKNDFLLIDPDCLDHRILDAANRLGWTN